MARRLGAPVSDRHRPPPAGEHVIAARRSGAKPPASPSGPGAVRGCGPPDRVPVRDRRSKPSPSSGGGCIYTATGPAAGRHRAGARTSADGTALLGPARRLVLSWALLANPHHATARSARNSANAPIRWPLLASSSAAMYSARCSTRITVHGYPPEHSIRFIRNRAIRPFPSGHGWM